MNASWLLGSLIMCSGLAIAAPNSPVYLVDARGRALTCAQARAFSSAHNYVWEYDDGQILKIDTDMDWQDLSCGSAGNRLAYNNRVTLDDWDCTVGYYCQSP